MTAYDVFDTDRPMRAIEQTTRTVEPYMPAPDAPARLVSYATPWLRTAVANSWLALRWLAMASAGVVLVVGVTRVVGWIA